MVKCIGPSVYPVDGDTVFISLKVDIIKHHFKNQVIFRNYYYNQQLPSCKKINIAE